MMCLFNFEGCCLHQQQVRPKKAKGFSLIELMVVMAIMAVLMSLSGGLMQKSINQQTRQVELEQVTQLFKKLGYKAYYGGVAIQVRLEQNQMQISYAVDGFKFNEQDINNQDINNQDISNQDISNQEYEMETIDFEQLTFVAQDYKISTKGVVTPNAYGVFGLQGTKKFQLQSLFAEQIL